MYRVGWSARQSLHMWDAHQVTPEAATEAVNDPLAIWEDPDSRSRSGQSVRVVGYSLTERAVLTVILLPKARPFEWAWREWLVG